jgi:hypothetical protein
MKKSVIITLILVTILFIISFNLFYYFFYINDFNKKTRIATEEEQTLVIEILTKQTNLEGYKIIFGRVYPTNRGDLIKVGLIKNNSRKDFLLNLDRKEIIKK